MRKIRVLIVDDEQAIRRFLRTSLTAHGYAVYEASSGNEALAAVIGNRPDLIAGQDDGTFQVLERFIRLVAEAEIEIGLQVGNGGGASQEHTEHSTDGEDHKNQNTDNFIHVERNSLSL